MGQKQTKKEKEEEEEKVYDKKMIYIDEYGNFVYGNIQIFLSLSLSLLILISFCSFCSFFLFLFDFLFLFVFKGDKEFDPDEEAIRVMKTDDPIEEVKIYYLEFLF